MHCGGSRLTQALGTMVKSVVYPSLVLGLLVSLAAIAASLVQDAHGHEVVISISDRTPTTFELRVALANGLSPAADEVAVLSKVWRTQAHYQCGSKFSGEPGELTFETHVDGPVGGTERSFGGVEGTVHCERRGA